MKLTHKTSKKYHRKAIFYFLVSIFFATLLLMYNFFNTFNNLDVEGDGFTYLNMVKHHIPPIPHRSPFILFFLLPNILEARLEMIIFHLCLTVLIFLITHKISKEISIAFLASILYGVNWWFVQFTTYALTELPALFLVFLSFYIIMISPRKKNQNYYILSGLLLGLASIIRYQYIIFGVFTSLYLIYRKKPIIKFLIPLLVMVGPVELLLDYFFYNDLIYAPWEFFYYVFLSETKLGGFYREIDLKHLTDVLLNKNPLIEPLYRWTLLPILPFFMIGVAILFKKITKRVSFNYRLFLIIFITIIYLVFNAKTLISIEYPTFRPDKVFIPKTWETSSNYRQAVMYYSGKDCFDLLSREISQEQKIEDVISRINNRNYLILFKYPPTTAEFFYNEIKDYADNNLELIDKFEDGWPIHVYTHTSQENFITLKSQDYPDYKLINNEVVSFDFSNMYIGPDMIPYVDLLLFTRYYSNSTGITTINYETKSGQYSGEKIQQSRVSVPLLSVSWIDPQLLLEDQLNVSFSDDPLYVKNLTLVLRMDNVTKLSNNFYLQGDWIKEEDGYTIPGNSINTRILIMNKNLLKLKIVYTDESSNNIDINYFNESWKSFDTIQRQDSGENKIKEINITHSYDLLVLNIFPYTTDFLIKGITLIPPNYIFIQNNPIIHFNTFIEPINSFQDLQNIPQLTKLSENLYLQGEWVSKNGLYEMLPDNYNTRIILYNITKAKLQLKYKDVGNANIDINYFDDFFDNKWKTIKVLKCSDTNQEKEVEIPVAISGTQILSFAIYNRESPVVFTEIKVSS